MKLSQNQRKIFSITIKMLVFVATLYYLYIKVLKDGSLKNSISDFEFNDNNLWLLIPVFFMMFINWGTEAFKWRMLISTFEKITFRRSFAAVWSGVTINNWVPNRMAEFAGRILFINKGNRGKAIISTFAGSMSQMGMTLSFGSVAVLLYYNLNGISSWLIPIGLLAANLLFVLFYFRMKWFVILVKQIQIFHFLTKYLEVLEQFSFGVLIRLLLLSLIRYLVYMSQFVLLLILFGMEIEWMIIYAGVALIFLIQTFIPSILLTDIGVRGATVLYVFEKVSPNVAGLLAAAYSIWFINLLLPSVVGAFFILLKKRKT